MSKMHGYAGNILKVDLTTKSISKTPLTEELINKFIGGEGINARLAYDSIEPGTDPFSPKNVMVFGVGPLVGTLTPGAGKSNIISKSPVSLFMGASGSGHLGVLKFAGYDHVMIKGKADRPVYLKIGDEVEICEASHIWHKDTWDSTDAIWKEIGRKYAVLTIGPAGENLVRDASVIADKYSAYGRTGMGAVMGSKNLKGIAAYGTHGITVAQPKRFMEQASKLCQHLVNLPDYKDFSKYGTLKYLDLIVQSDQFAYKNFRQIAGRKSFELGKLLEGVDRSSISCFACPVGCKHYFCGKDGGEYAGLSVLVSCAMAPIFGSINCGSKSWLPTLQYVEMCNRLGMDNLNITALVAMSIELYERGIINKSDTGGQSFDWDAATLLSLVQDIAYRKGFGNILADGMIEASKQIGRNAEDYAIHTKGLNSADHRILLSTDLFSAITNIHGHPSAHDLTLFGKSPALFSYCQRIGMSEKDIERILSGPGGFNVARLTKWGENYNFALECLGICFHYLYQEFDIDIWANLYSAVTGIDVDGTGLLKAAARGWDIRKAFNIREGATRKDDRVPKRFLTESVQKGDVIYPPLSMEYLDSLITDYYEERGWDTNEGTLSPQRIAEITGVG